MVHKFAKPGIIIIAILVLLATLCFFLLAGNEEKSPENQVRIGVIVGTTGNFSPYGEMILHGAQLAAMEANEKSGFEKVVLVVEDSQSSAEKAISAYQKISGSVNALVSGQSTIVLALAPLAENDKKVLLNTSAMSPDIRKAGDFVFSNINDSTVEVSSMADFIYNKEKLGNVAVFYQNDAGGLSAKNVFSGRFLQLGGTIAAEESFNGRANDVRTQLMKIAESNPDGVYLPAYPENVALILKQAKELGFATRWFSWNIEGQEIIDVAGDAAEGFVYSTNAFDENNSNENVQAFVKKFSEQFGIMPNIYAATAYDGIWLLALASDKSDGSAESIKNQLYSIKAWPGASGITAFDSDGMAVKVVGFKTIKNGEFADYAK